MSQSKQSKHASTPQFQLMIHPFFPNVLQPVEQFCCSWVPILPMTNCVGFHVLIPCNSWNWELMFLFPLTAHVN